MEIKLLLAHKDERLVVLEISRFSVFEEFVVVELLLNLSQLTKIFTSTEARE